MTDIVNIELLDSVNLIFKPTNFDEKYLYFIKYKNDKLYINDTVPELMFFTQKDSICLRFYQTQECAPYIMTADLPSIL